jgi:hypothetical protein
MRISEDSREEILGKTGASIIRVQRDFIVK